MNEAMLQDWKKGTSAFISFKLIQAPKPFMIQTTLKGFTKALAQTKLLAGK